MMFGNNGSRVKPRQSKSWRTSKTARAIWCVISLLHSISFPSAVASRECNFKVRRRSRIDSLRTKRSSRCRLSIALHLSSPFPTAASFIRDGSMQRS